MATLNKLVYGFLILFLWSACTPRVVTEKIETPPPPPPVVSNEAPPKEVEKTIELIASIRRTPCFGQCPVYSAEVYSDGTVHYSGRAYVARLGPYKATISKTDLQKLQAEAKDIQYLDLSGTYPKEGERIIADLPLTTTYLKIENQEKRIENRHGGPPELRDFENYFDTLLDTLKWQERDGE